MIRARYVLTVLTLRERSIDISLTVFREAVLGQVASRARFERPPRKLLLGVHAEKKNRQFGPQTLQVVQNVEPAFSGHTDIEDDYVPVLATHLLQCFLCRCCLPESHSGECFRQSLSQSSAKYGMIVRDQNSHYDFFSWRPGGGEESSGSWLFQRRAPLQFSCLR